MKNQPSKKAEPRIYKFYEGDVIGVDREFVSLPDYQALQEKLKIATEAMSNWKKQVDAYGGDYLPGNYKQIADALAKIEGHE